MKKATKKTATEEFDYTSIKTFEDACNRLNILPSEPDIKLIHAEPLKSMKAYYRLVIILLAINNGWKPDWNKLNQSKHYPYFWVLSSGFGFGVSLCGCDHSVTRVGSRLCTDTRDKALYIAEQFKDLYQEYLLYSK